MSLESVAASGAKVKQMISLFLLVIDVFIGFLHKSKITLTVFFSVISFKKEKKFFRQF